MTLLPSLLISIALLSNPEDKASCIDDDPLDCRQTMQEGELIPFNGQLLTPRRAARLAVQAGQCQERTAAAVSEAVKLVEVDLKLEKSFREGDQESAKTQKGVLEEALANAHGAAETDFLDSPVLWFSLGAVAAIAAMVTTAIILEKTRPQIVTIPVANSSATLVAW